MTVDDKSFKHFALNNQIKARDWVNQVKEVTGIHQFLKTALIALSLGCNDEDEIKRAFEKSKDSNGEFSLSGAVEQLLGSASRTSAVVSGSSGSTSVALNTSPQKAKVVDLTDDNKTEDDLQKAIALSLQDGGLVSQGTVVAGASNVSGISQEEQDVSKALEASLLETTQSGRKSSQNPRDRQRDGGWPVGLKNVGQTCWFSAVIQSLFHIPAFRTLVLNYTPPKLEANSEKRKKILEFMLELRKLFSLLLNSQRKYVDPSRAVGILRGTLGGGGESSRGGSNQQDVSEFTHKLLDWLEEAFSVPSSASCDMDKQKVNDGNEPMDSDCEKMDKEKESEEKCLPSSALSDINQMNSLFYGKVEIEGRNQGIGFSRTEQFGQWPLQVNGFKHIHDSLEASMAYQAIDSGVTSVLSGQERWFTILPPVLFLELSRFQFNTSKGMAEKVNNILEFPQDIFLDRYLEINKDLVRKKRKEVKTLIDRREYLKNQLDCYMRYRSGSEEPSQHEQYPLVSILRSALEFAKSGQGDCQEAAEAAEVTMQVDSPCHSPASLTPAQSLTNLGGHGEASPDPGAPLSPVSVAIPIVREEPDQSLDAMEVETADSEHLIPSIRPPRPRIVSEMEMKVLSSCLSRWIKEVDEEIVALTLALESIEGSISVMYEEEGLKLKGYRLHAVMVHEGDVNQGHYWAYVNHAGLGWLKFNDNTVSQTSWEEISKEAVGGGQSSTSAYSCVYVDVARSNLFFGPNPPHLPTDLDVFVMEDNKNFAAEVVKWDEEQQKQKEEEAVAATATSGASGATADSTGPVLIGDDPDCQIIEPTPDLAQSHALLAKEITLEFFGLVVAEKKKGEATKNNTSNVINKIYAAIKPKVAAGRSEGFADSLDIRLESFLHYLIANELTVDHYKKALLEQVALKQFEIMSELGGEVAKTARDSLKQIPPQVSDEVTLWHRTYHQFRIAVNYFVLGVEKYTENLAEDALELLTISYVVNDKIMEDPPQGLHKVRRSKKSSLL